MQPISPVRRPPRPPPVLRSACLRRAAFTLIEVVIALALCALVAGAVGVSLGAALRAERQAVGLREARRAADKLMDSRHATFPEDLVLTNLAAHWQLTPGIQTTGEGAHAAQWTVWELNRIRDSSQRARIALRAPANEGP